MASFLQASSQDHSGINIGIRVASFAINSKPISLTHSLSVVSVDECVSWRLDLRLFIKPKGCTRQRCRKIRCTGCSHQKPLLDAKSRSSPVQTSKPEKQHHLLFPLDFTRPSPKLNNLRNKERGFPSYQVRNVTVQYESVIKRSCGIHHHPWCGVWERERIRKASGKRAISRNPWKLHGPIHGCKNTSAEGCYLCLNNF